jgi:hypothetical protein
MVYGLFQYDVGIYITPNGYINKFKRILKQSVVANRGIISQLPVGTETKHGKTPVRIADTPA